MQTNKILVLVGIVILGIIFGTGWMLKAQQNTIEKWEADYGLLKINLEKSENTVINLTREREDLLETLKIWKEKYEKITRENDNAREQIRNLQKANAEICEFLASNIPDDLWNILFPQNGNAPYCISN